MLDGLHELLEFVREGLTVTDTLDPDDEHVAFRTLVQPNGDVCTMIDPRALSRPDFAALHRAHLEHVERSLLRHTESLRRWSRLADAARPGLALGVVASCWGSGLLDALLLGDLQALVQVLGISGVGVLLWPITRSLLHGRLLARQQGAARARLADVMARLQVP